MRKRIERLETCLTTTLFVRTRQGVIPTDEGRAVLRAIDSMREYARGLPFHKGNQSLKRPGEFRIACTDALVERWLLSQLATLKDALPNLTISVHSIRSAEGRSGDYDLTLALDRPSDAEAVSARIGSLHFMMFASDAYLDRFGTPTSVNDLVGHHVIMMDSVAPEHNLLAQFAGHEVMRSLRVAKVGTDGALYEAVLRDLGIGMLPTVAAAMSRSIRALPLPVERHSSLFLIFDGPYRGSAPLKLALDWIRNSVQGPQLPWFAERFVHPDDFAQIGVMVPAAGIEPAAP